MATFEIPLTAEPQTLTIALAGASYQLTLHWCNPASAWILDIADASGNPIISGIPLVTGADLLAQYPSAGIGGQLIAFTDNSPDTPPAYTTLGSTGHLRFVTS